jgi:ElaB/YqjD/DUF883 family membrane-anchored ribosome-binding protein
MNETIESTFPQTRQELSNLKGTAIDAAKDIGSTASVHAKKVQGNLQNLASSAQKEGGEQLDQAKANLADFGNVARDYIAARPLASIGVALAVGFLVGKMRSSRFL